MGTFNKTTAAVIAGAVATIVAAILARYGVMFDTEFWQSVQTIVTAIFVYLIPNREHEP